MATNGYHCIASPGSLPKSFAWTRHNDFRGWPTGTGKITHHRWLLSVLVVKKGGKQKTADIQTVMINQHPPHFHTTPANITTSSWDFVWKKTQMALVSSAFGLLAMEEKSSRAHFKILCKKEALIWAGKTCLVKAPQVYLHSQQRGINNLQNMKSCILHPLIWIRKTISL